VVVGTREGIGRRISLLTTGAEVAAIVAVTAVTALALLPAPASPVLFTVALVVAALVFGRLVGLGARRLDATTHLTPSAAGAFVVGHEVVFSVRAIGFWALLHLVAAHSVPSLAHTAGAVGLSYFLGTVAVFSPGGVGVREAVLVGLLSSTTGAQAAVAAAVAWRLLELLVELAILAWTRTLRTRVVTVGTTGVES
jgi:uncharacterized membrane protein YbhN (UPF0104 family)